MRSHCAFVGYPTLVHETSSSVNRHTSTFAQEEESRDLFFDGESAPNLMQNPVFCMQAVREVLHKSGISGKIADIILSAWRSGTSKAYNTCVERWVFYCRQGGQDPLQPTVIADLQFLTLLYEEPKVYSSLNIVRCAVSKLSVGKDTMGSNDLISKYFVRCFQKAYCFAQEQCNLRRRCGSEHTENMGTR